MCNHCWESRLVKFQNNTRELTVGWLETTIGKNNERSITNSKDPLQDNKSLTRKT